MNGKQPLIYGDGLQSRDFSYVENIVQANLLAAAAPNVGGHVVNIACGGAHTLLDLVRVLNQIIGTSIAPTFQPARKGDVLHSLADISRAETLIGYKPNTGWEEGLRRTVAWYKNQRSDN